MHPDVNFNIGSDSSAKLLDKGDDRLCACQKGLAAVEHNDATLYIGFAGVINQPSVETG